MKMAIAARQEFFGCRQGRVSRHAVVPRTNGYRQFVTTADFDAASTSVVATHRMITAERRGSVISIQSRRSLFGMTSPGRHASNFLSAISSNTFLFIETAVVPHFANRNKMNLLLVEYSLVQWREADGRNPL
jgi:hypothetical protein